MKKFYTLALILTCASSLSAQNLVNNPDFDIVAECIDGKIVDDNTIAAAEGWVGATNGTANHYDPCHTTLGSNFTPPDNFVGWQYAYNDESYAGIVCGGDTLDFGGGYREYIQTFLTEPLIEGHTYHCGFYCSLAENSVIGINNMGLYCSEEAISQIGSAFMDYEAQIQTNEIITDTVNWVLVSGEFVAEGGEAFVTVGNFMAPTSTDYIAINPPNFFNDAYYYIDAVYVIDVTTSNITDIEIFESLYPNPTGDQLFLRFNHHLSNERVYVIDASGRIIISEQVTGIRHEIDLSGVAQGMYMVQIESNGDLETQKFIKH